MQVSETRSNRAGIDFLARLAWILFLITLPVTSFPYFPDNIGGGTLVRPLSLYPLLFLLIFVVVPRFLTRPLPRTLLSFLPFVVAVIAASILATFRDVEGLQGVTVLARTLRALATLGFGAAMYLAVVLWPASLEELDKTLRWLYIGFAIALAWGTLQVVYIITADPDWFNLMNAAQEAVSIRRLFPNRVSGMTYEPNWFADQISFLYLPWLLAAVLTGTTAFRRRWRWLTFEAILLAWSLVLLPFTFSRAGLAIAVVVVILGILFFRRYKSQEEGVERRATRGVILRLLEAGVLLAALAALTYFAGTRNEFFARVWDYWRRRPDQGYVRYLFDYFEYLGFGARFTYWETAYNIFEENPVSGVGLGNYAFYFDQALPDRPLSIQPEVLRLIVPEEGRNRLITAKNFFLRLLAETGLLGAATFLGFLAAIVGCALFLWFSNSQQSKFWGTGSLLGLIAFILASFSFDSFAVPNLWIVFGLITSAAHLERGVIREFD
jgi:O-antigen ligase